MSKKCPKCQSPNIYQQEGKNACMMCGTRFPLNLKPDQEVASLSAEKAKEKKIMPENEDAHSQETELGKIMVKARTGEIGTCWNCVREKWIAGNGLCNTCFKAVKSIPPDTEEYKVALAAVKERIESPDFRHHTQKKSGKKKSVQSKKKIPTKKLGTAKPTPALEQTGDNTPAENPINKFQETPNPAESAKPDASYDEQSTEINFDGMKSIVVVRSAITKTLKAELSWHISEAEKISQAIQLIEP